MPKKLKRIPVAIKPRDMAALVQMLDSVVGLASNTMAGFPRDDSEQTRAAFRAWRRYERKARALSSQFSGIYLCAQNGILPSGTVNLDR